MLLKFLKKAKFQLSKLIAFIFCFGFFYAGSVYSGNGEAEKDPDRPYLLGIIGYNYTDRNISQFRVNGAGGDEVNLSSPGSGGSNITCCVQLDKKTKFPIAIIVEWQFDGCIYKMQSPLTKTIYKNRHHYFRKTKVDVPEITSSPPQYMEIHFYPDGKVEAAITNHFSQPRLQLDPNRPDRSQFPRCKNDEKPKRY
jgi:hypothetical protein